MTEITEDMIGCLCRFWDDDDCKCLLNIGILKGIERKHTYDTMFGYFPYRNGQDLYYKHCEPVKPDEVKFYDHIGDVNEKVDHISQEAKKVKLTEDKI